MDIDSSDILGGPMSLNARDSQSGWWSSLPLGAKSAFGLTVVFVLYLVVIRIQETYLVLREKAYKLSMRRRHGIPDTDHRPFNVAYAAVLRARQEGQEKARKARLQELLQDPQSALPDEGVRQRNGISSNVAATRSSDPLPGHYESLDIFPAARASSSNLYVSAIGRKPSEVNPSQFIGSVRPSQASADDYYNPNPAVRIANPEIDNSPPKSGPSRQAPRFVDDEGLKRGHTGDESDSPEHTKKTRVNDDDELDGDQEPEWIEDYSSRRGWKRGHGDDEDAHESPRIRDKRQRKISIDKTYHVVNEDMDVDDEDEDDIQVLRSGARGKKRDRAEAGSTFGGDDEDDSGHEVDSEKAHRHRKRRTYTKRKSDGGASSRGRKRDRDLAEDDSEAENEDNTSLKASRKKRGKRSSLAVPQDDRSDVSMDESQPSSARGRPRRSIGDEWESNGVKYKIGSNGQRLRQTLVKKERQKFHMPEDSQHPDRQANLEVYVESWLTEEEYREAKEQQLLAWQDSSNKPSVEPQTPTIESQEDLSSANGKSLLWKSMSASANPETSTPQQITTPPVTPQPTQPLFGSSVASTLGLRINPLGNVPPAGKRISSAIRRPSAMRSDGTTTVPPSPTGSVAHGLADSTNNNPCHKAFSKWEKQDLEAKAMMKMREANRLKEEERLHKLKKEQEAAAPPKIVPTITVTKADDAKPAETKPAGLFCAPPTPAAADAPKKGAPNPSNPLFGPPKAATQPPSFTLPTSQPAFKPPTIPAPTSTLGGASTKPTGSLFGSKPNPLNSFVSFGPPSSSTPTPSAAAPSAPVASANPDIPTSKLSFSFGPLPGALAQPSQAHASEKKTEPAAGGSLLSRMAPAASGTPQAPQAPSTFGLGKPPTPEAPKTTFGTPQPPAQSQPTPAETTSVPKFSFGFPKFPNKSTGGTPAALPSSSSSLTGALGSEAAQSAASPFSFSKPSTSAEKGNAAPANVPAAPTANDNAPSAPKFSFGMPSSSSSSSGSNSFAVKGPPSTTATSGTTAAQSSFGGFGAKPAGESSSTSVPAPSAFGFGSKPATNGPSAPAAQSVFGAQSTAGSSSTAGSAPAFGLGAKPAATSSSTSVPAPSAFGFGSKPVTNGPSAPAAQSVFGAQSTAGSSSTAGSAPAFGFGAKPAASSSSTSAPAQSAFDASSTTTPAPSFGGFGAQPTSSTTGPAQSTFGSSGAFSAKPDTSSAPAPASSAFSFGATNVAVASGAAPSPFGASNNVFGGGAFGASVTPSAPPGAAAKNGAPASKPVFSFGTPSSMTPTGTPSAIPAPAAPAAAPSAFGTSSAFGSSASNATPALGTFSFGDAAKNTAPATNSLFGKPADPSAFGFGAGNAFSTFGKSPTGQQQQ